jgi:hypothetical protein
MVTLGLRRRRDKEAARRGRDEELMRLDATDMLAL